jgi:hypothetical protein
MGKIVKVMYVKTDSNLLRETTVTHSRPSFLTFPIKGAGKLEKKGGADGVIVRVRRVFFKSQKRSSFKRKHKKRMNDNMMRV